LYFLNSSISVAIRTSTTLIGASYRNFSLRSTNIYLKPLTKQSDVLVCGSNKGVLKAPNPQPYEVVMPLMPENWKMFHREESEEAPEPFTCPSCGGELPTLEMASVPGDHPSGVAEIQCICQCGNTWLEVVTWDKTMVHKGRSAK
jgi:hypothetical protein